MKENKMNFVEYLYKTENVKDASEAFREFPPENEWHKGKIENILSEQKEIYTIYSVGDIVYVKDYQYEDGSIGTNHLFVIIDKDNIAIPMENFGMLISSQIQKVKYKNNVMLKKNKQNGLMKDSIVKTDCIYKIKNEQILFKIGSVEKENIENYKEMYLNEKK